MKARKHEPVRYMVKWIEGSTMYFRAFKRDNAAMKFMDYLTEQVGVDPARVRVVTTKN